MYQARPHQSLSTHEQECSRTMSTLLAPLGLSQFGALIGGMHDFGKMSADFQQYMDALSQHISPPIPKSGIDHSTAGAQFVWNYFPIPEDSEEFFIFRQIIALCIASHHNSALIDCFRGTMPGDDVFSKRMEKSGEKTHLDEILSKLTFQEKDHYYSLLKKTELATEFRECLHPPCHPVWPLSKKTSIPCRTNRTVLLEQPYRSGLHQCFRKRKLRKHSGPGLGRNVKKLE